jgi:hypothetical protein
MPWLQKTDVNHLLCCNYGFPMHELGVLKRMKRDMNGGGFHGLWPTKPTIVENRMKRTLSPYLLFL